MELLGIDVQNVQYWRCFLSLQQKSSIPGIDRYLNANLFT